MAFTLPRQCYSNKNPPDGRVSVCLRLAEELPATTLFPAEHLLGQLAAHERLGRARVANGLPKLGAQICILSPFRGRPFETSGPRLTQRVLQPFFIPTR